MNGIKFDGKHSYDDFGLILTSVTLPNPKPKTYELEVPGADGSMDLTGLFGAVRYHPRTINLTFAFSGGHWRRHAKNSEVANALHGQKMKLILDDDASYYYVGRVNYKEWKVDKSIGTLEFEVIADPYKYELQSSLDDWLWDPFNFDTGIIREYKNIRVDGSHTLNIPGLKKPVTPVIISNAAMTVTFDGKQYDLRTGEQKIYGITITEGDNYLTFTGNGTISIDYRGGIL